MHKRMRGSSFRIPLHFYGRVNSARTRAARFIMSFSFFVFCVRFLRFAVLSALAGTAVSEIMRIETCSFFIMEENVCTNVKLQTFGQHACISSLKIVRTSSKHRPEVFQSLSRCHSKFFQQLSKGRSKAVRLSSESRPNIGQETLKKSFKSNSKGIQQYFIGCEQII